MKKIKRFLTLSIALVFAVCALSGITAFAAEDDMFAVYVKVPADWQAPSAWAWNDDGTNAFAAWPGAELDMDAANEGWYYIWLPSFANNLIISANNSEIQTEGLVIEPKNAWVTITDAETVDISYDAQTTGEAPEYVEKFTLHATVSESWQAPSLWAWSAPDGTNLYEAWPGKELRMADDGSYTASIPIWVNSVIINANGGEVQTEDISIDAAEVWITVEENGTFDFSYNDPAMADVPDITVYAMAPADWEMPNLWAWSAPDGTNVFASWPGEPLEEGEDGWLMKTVPGWVNSIIINANEGTVQTTDVSIETGKDVWVMVNGPEEFEVYYEMPETAAAEEPMTEDEDTAENAEEAAEPVPESTNNTTLYIIIGVVVVAVIGGAVVLSKKKKS